MYGLTDNELEKLCNLFRKHEEIEQAVLYGSRAKGNFKPFSDIDITLMGDRLTYKMLEQPREMGEMTLKDFVPMSLRCQMRSNRKSGKCKEKQNIAGERFANHYPRRCKI